MKTNSVEIDRVFDISDDVYAAVSGVEDGRCRDLHHYPTYAEWHRCELHLSHQGRHLARPEGKILQWYYPDGERP